MVEDETASNKQAKPATQSAPPVSPVHDPHHEGHLEPDLPHIRTYSYDLNEEIKKKGSTLTSIVGAERERTARELASNKFPEPQTPKRTTRVILLITAIVLIGVSISALAGTFYYLSIDSALVPQTPQLIFPNKVTALIVPQKRGLTDLLATMRTQTTLSLGEIQRIDITLENATTSAQHILSRLGVPSGLVREANALITGTHAFNYNQPFIIVQVMQYDRAYGAMLGWEEDMGRALGAWYRPLNGTVPPTLLFTDKVIQNIDTRVSQSAWPILYAFPRRDILVITTNQHTLQEILTRLNAQLSTSNGE